MGLKETWNNIFSKFLTILTYPKIYFSNLPNNGAFKSFDYLSREKLPCFLL